MGVTFNRKHKMKYTDMCIYIDAHSKYLKNAGEYPEIENTIFEYLYHLFYALSYKSGYFQKFTDYDAFALYAATEVFNVMRRKLLDDGKEVRGKIVRPIKNCLDFVKAVMFPLKINFQQENFFSIITPDMANTAKLENNIRDTIQENYRVDTISCCKDVAHELPYMLKHILDQTPYRNDPIMRHRLEMSIILTFIYDITLPNKLKARIFQDHLESGAALTSKNFYKIAAAYEVNKDQIIQWHIDDDMQGYIRLLTIRLRQMFIKKLIEYVHEGELSEVDVENIMKSAYNGGAEQVEDIDI